MGTEVLRPQDLLLGDRFGLPLHRRKQFPANGTVAVSRKQIHGGYAKKTYPKKKTSDGGVKKGSPVRSDVRRKDDGGNRSPTMGKVTILRRGESLDSLTLKIKGGNPKSKSPEAKPADDLTVLGTGKVGSDLAEISPRQISLSPPSYHDGYAGSGFVLSPSPRSLPLPSFFNKKPQNDVVTKVVDSATRDLRRLLRLD